MHEKGSKKRSTWRFLRNLRKYETDFKSSGWKLMVMTALALTQVLFFIGDKIPLPPKGEQEQETF